MLARGFAAAATAVLLATSTFAADPASPVKSTAERPSETWDDIRAWLYDDREIRPAEAAVALDAPYRAHDAAVVPVTVTLTPPPGRRIVGLTLVVDNNPAPVAAQMAFGEGDGPMTISTRLRVDAYSNLRAVAELDDGALLHTARFVKASGGCSAPAGKDPEAALASMGRMKLRQFQDDGNGGALQLMLSHPNHSGFQMDQVTGLYTPARFVDEIEVRQGDRTLLRVTGGISLSEDPSIRFSYHAESDAALEVRATDTEGAVFEGAFSVAGSS